MNDDVVAEATSFTFNSTGFKLCFGIEHDYVMLQALFTEGVSLH